MSASVDQPARAPHEIFPHLRDLEDEMLRRACEGVGTSVKIEIAQVASMISEKDEFSDFILGFLKSVAEVELEKDDTWVRFSLLELD